MQHHQRLIYAAQTVAFHLSSSQLLRLCCLHAPAAGRDGDSKVSMRTQDSRVRAPGRQQGGRCTFTMRRHASHTYSAPAARSSKTCCSQWNHAVVTSWMSTRVSLPLLPPITAEHLHRRLEQLEQGPTEGLKLAKCSQISSQHHHHQCNLRASHLAQCSDGASKASCRQKLICHWILRQHLDHTTEKNQSHTDHAAIR